MAARGTSWRRQRRRRRRCRWCWCRRRAGAHQRVAIEEERRHLEGTKARVQLEARRHGVRDRLPPLAHVVARRRRKGSSASEWVTSAEVPQALFGRQEVVRQRSGRRVELVVGRARPLGTNARLEGLHQPGACLLVPLVAAHQRRRRPLRVAHLHHQMEPMAFLWQDPPPRWRHYRLHALQRVRVDRVAPLDPQADMFQPRLGLDRPLLQPVPAHQRSHVYSLLACLEINCLTTAQSQHHINQVGVAPSGSGHVAPLCAPRPRHTLVVGPQRGRTRSFRSELALYFLSSAWFRDWFRGRVLVCSRGRVGLY